MSGAPCQGCPPDCTKCPIATIGRGLGGDSPEVLISAGDYGCVQPGFGGIVKIDDQVGQIRHGRFHPITEIGKAELRDRGSPVADFLAEAA